MHRSGYLSLNDGEQLFSTLDILMINASVSRPLTFSDNYILSRAAYTDCSSGLNIFLKREGVDPNVPNEQWVRSLGTVARIPNLLR